MDDYLTQGVAAVKAGNTQQARKLLDMAIRAAPDDIRGWGWFYGVCANDTERLKCLKEILRIDPGNVQAKQVYAELTKAANVPFPVVNTNQQNVDKWIKRQKFASILGSISSTTCWLIVLIPIILLICTCLYIQLTAK